MWLDFKCQTSKRVFRHHSAGCYTWAPPHPPLPLGCPPGWYYFEKIFFSDNSSKDKDKAIISGFHGFPGLTVSPLEGLFISSTNEMGAGGGAKLNLLQ